MDNLEYSRRLRIIYKRVSFKNLTGENTIHILDKVYWTLRTTVPLVSYIRNSLRFWYYASFSTCCQNLEKNWGHRENLGESGGQTFKGSDREKCQF